MNSLLKYKTVEIMKEAENLNNAETQALNIPVVICRASFAGTISKNQF